MCNADPGIAVISSGQSPTGAPNHGVEGRLGHLPDPRDLADMDMYSIHTYLTAVMTSSSCR